MHLAEKSLFSPKISGTPSVLAKSLAGMSISKWPVLCQVGRQILTQSINLLITFSTLMQFLLFLGADSICSAK